MARVALKPMVRGAGTVGFSLVEMLVALLFVGILMAGMANLFRSSLGNIAASGEGISALRRNRVSVDLLYDDLNSAGLFLNDLSVPPRLSPTNPVFYILPNVPIAGATAGDPAQGDQLFSYMDEPLAFEGNLIQVTLNGPQNYAPGASESVALGLSQGTSQDVQYQVDCHDSAYAATVKAGYGAVFMDSFEVVRVSTLSPPTPGQGSYVTFTSKGDPDSAITGTGAMESMGRNKHLHNARVLFFRPRQMVRYSLKMKSFDPQKPSGMPCLVRDQGTYDPSGFVPDPSLEAIVAENVSGFKVYLSADSGQTWAGSGKTDSGFNDGWLGGIQAELNTQLATAGRPGYRSTSLDATWIRSLPVLVRADITTRSATQRTENAPPTSAPAPVYKEYTQSLVMVPRHFGLPFN